MGSGLALGPALGPKTFPESILFFLSFLSLSSLLRTEASATDWTLPQSWRATFVFKIVKCCHETRCFLKSHKQHFTAEVELLHHVTA